MKEWLFIIFFSILVLGGVFTAGYFVGNAAQDKEPEIIYAPVEKEVIKNIYITRDSIIYKTKYIKLIQHDTIEKIYTLSNDSTVALFYRLVSE